MRHVRETGRLIGELPRSPGKRTDAAPGETDFTRFLRLTCVEKRTAQNWQSLSDRIKARAIRRCGELLKQIPPSKGGYAALFDAREGDHPSIEPLSAQQQERIDRVLYELGEGHITRARANARIAKIDPHWMGRARQRQETRSEVADAAGLSEHQRKTALRVASVPAADFERQVESDDPPTVMAAAFAESEPFATWSARSGRSRFRRRRV